MTLVDLNVVLYAINTAGRLPARGSARRWYPTRQPGVTGAARATKLA